MAQKSTREFIRSKPKPTKIEALNFARSVLRKQGCFKDYGPYCPEDGETIENARKAFEKHRIDASEVMAFEMIEYALEGRA